MAKIPKDARSTGRKRGRATLFRTLRPHFCASCGRGPNGVPASCPQSYREKIILAPVELQVEGLELECNHINKNILDNDPVNLEWLCKSCHKRKDQQTEKGVSLKEDEFGYGDVPAF